MILFSLTGWKPCLFTNVLCEIPKLHTSKIHNLVGNPARWVCFFIKADFEEKSHQWSLCNEWVPSEWDYWWLWCLYQLFGLSFRRHPFTAEDPLMSKRCNAIFLQIWRNKLIFDGLRMHTFFTKFGVFGWTIAFMYTFLNSFEHNQQQHNFKISLQKLY